MAVSNRINRIVIANSIAVFTHPNVIADWRNAVAGIVDARFFLMLVEGSKTKDGPNILGFVYSHL